MPPRIRFSCVLSCLLLAVGCGDDALRRYDSAVLAAEDGRNSAALNDAAYAARNLSGSNQYRAQYVAGLAAARLNRDKEARRYLERAILAVDKEVSGKAYIELGMLDTRANRPLSAAGCFERAANRFNAPENGRAMLLAAESYTKAGRSSDARRCLAIARRSGDGDTSSKASTRLVTTGYTIQFGSYASEKNARKRALEISPIAKNAGLGQVRVLMKKGEWKVQVGNFVDRRRASQSLQRLGRNDAYVEQLGS